MSDVTSTMAGADFFSSIIQLNPSLFHADDDSAVLRMLESAPPSSTSRRWKISSSAGKFILLHWATMSDGLGVGLGNMSVCKVEPPLTVPKSPMGR